TALIMAAGEGTRMRSSLPKVLHEVCGRPMIAWPVRAAREAGAGRICVIVSPDRDISAALPDRAQTIVEPEPHRNGRSADGALRPAVGAWRDSDPILVLSGDHPLVSAEIIGGLLEAHRDNGAAATVMTTEMNDPGSYGRVLRGPDGEIERVVEAKKQGDATP